MKGTILVSVIVVYSALAYSMTDAGSSVSAVNQRSNVVLAVDTDNPENTSNPAIDDSPSKGRRDCLPQDIEIVWSYPADGFVDVRAAHSADGKPVGIILVDVEFDRKVELSHDCVQLVSAAEDVPEIVSITGEGTYWTIELDRPIAAGHSTAMAFSGGRASLVFHSRSGDMNERGSTDDTGLKTLALAGNNAQDGNRSSGTGNDDLDRIYCCCYFGGCHLALGDGCPSASTEIACPCNPNPCPPIGNSGAGSTLLASGRK